MGSIFESNTSSSSPSSENLLKNLTTVIQVTTEYSSSTSIVLVNSSLPPYTLQLIHLRDSTRFWVQKVLVPIVTLFGLVGNILTGMVMCQRKMRQTSSTHIYLASLALFDALHLMFIFLLSLIHYHSIQTDLTAIKMAFWRSYPGLVFGCDFASNTSIWLTVVFTIERFIVVRYPFKGKMLCTRKRAVKAIILIGISCFVFTSPTFFEWEIVLSDTKESVSVDYTDFGKNSCYQLVYYWFSVMAFVFVPLTILTVFNVFLMNSVQKSARVRREWMRVTLSSTSTSTSLSCSDRLGDGRLTTCQSDRKNVKPNVVEERVECKLVESERYRHLKRQDSHITRLLIAVVLFFIVCQSPSAAVIIYTSYFEESPKGNSISSQSLILQTLGNVFNLLVSINSAGNFVLYCLLSRKYRQTLKEIFSFG